VMPMSIFSVTVITAKARNHFQTHHQRWGSTAGTIAGCFPPEHTGLENAFALDAYFLKRTGVHGARKAL